MPKIVSVEEEKLKILHALEMAVKEAPLLSVSMRDIAAKAGFSHSKILTYYETKDELINAYVDYVIDQYVEGLPKIAQIVKNKEPGTDLYEEFIRQLYLMDPESTQEKVFLQLYALGIYDTHVKKKIMQAFDSWKEVYKDVFVASGFDISGDFTDLFQAFMEGILLYRVYSGTRLENTISALHEMADHH